jgi:hypothetical protein
MRGCANSQSPPCRRLPEGPRTDPPRRSSSTTGAPISAQLSLKAKRLRRRREEQEEGPGKLRGGACITSLVSLRFSLGSLCFEIALCLNAIIPFIFINTLAPLRESATTDDPQTGADHTASAARRKPSGRQAEAQRHRSPAAARRPLFGTAPNRLPIQISLKAESEVIHDPAGRTALIPWASYHSYRVKWHRSPREAPRRYTRVLVEYHRSASYKKPRMRCPTTRVL